MGVWEAAPITGEEALSSTISSLGVAAWLDWLGSRDGGRGSQDGRKASSLRLATGTGGRSGLSCRLVLRVLFAGGFALEGATDTPSDDALAL